MRLAHDEVLHLRVPREMRAALDGQARAAGVKLSVATRTALSVGLAAIAPPDQPDPPPAAPGARPTPMQAAA